MNNGNIKRREIIKIICMAVAALLILLLSYFVFSSEYTQSASLLSDEELKLQKFLSQIEGVGGVSVIINGEGEEVSVVIVCDGADSLSVRGDILNAVRLATGAEGSNILIYKKG